MKQIINRFPKLKKSFLRILRNNPYFYEKSLKKRGKVQEDNYLDLVVKYADDASYFDLEEISKKLLRTRISPPTKKKTITKDVSIISVYFSTDFTSPIIPELKSNFNIYHFELSRYLNDPSFNREDGVMRDCLQIDLISYVDDVLKKQAVDLILLYITLREINVNTLRSLKKYGIPIAVISMDDKHTFQHNTIANKYGQKQLINEVDIILTTSKQAYHWYIKEGGSAYYMPEAADPEIFCYNEIAKDIDVSFIGLAYGYRFGFIKLLQKAGINVQCFGKNWGTGIISHEQKVEIYNRSKINLGIGWTGVSDKMTCLKGRDFEIPMTGGLYLTNFDYELANCFTIGKELLCFSNHIDCIEQIKFYLNNPVEAEQIRSAARERARAQHSWTIRFSTFFKWMDILE